MLVAAFRADHAHHDEARAWLSQARNDCARGAETLALLPMVLTGFLRLVTNPRVFNAPTRWKMRSHSSTPFSRRLAST